MTRHPTPYETVFLKEFYRMYSRYHLAQKLEITENELDGMLRHLGLRKKIEDKPKVELLTVGQKMAYIKNLRKGDIKI
jgi:hypothetical protein